MKKRFVKGTSVLMAVLMAAVVLAGVGSPVSAKTISRMTASQVMDKMEKAMKGLNSVTVDSEGRLVAAETGLTIESTRTTEIDRTGKTAHSTATINGREREAYLSGDTVYIYSQTLDQWIAASGDPAQIAKVKAAVQATVQSLPSMFLWTIDKERTTDQVYVLVTHINLQDLQETAAAQLDIPEETLSEMASLNVDVALFINKSTYYLEKIEFSGTGTDAEANQIDVAGSAIFREYNSTTVTLPDMSGALPISVDQIVDKVKGVIDALQQGTMPDEW